MLQHAMPDHTIRIYTPDAGLQAEDRALAAQSPALTGQAESLAQFCAFVGFYTRRAVDPFSTSLACEKQAEGVQLRAEDATPENLRLLMDTLLETIDHLEKKWLDEQLKLEERQRLHRTDVARLSAEAARLSAQLRELQPKPTVPWLARSVQAMQQAFGGKPVRPRSKHRPVSVAV